MQPADYRPRPKELRQAGGVTRSQMALLLGVERLTLRDWERGQAPIPDELIHPLADRFGCTVSYLMRWNWDWDDDGLEDLNAGEMTAADRTEERAVLREASDALRAWAERLPNGSSWRRPFADISRLVEGGQ